MDQKLIATLLRPFLQRDLSIAQVGKVAVYIDTLMKWNARINLTSIRNEQQIVTRHFGESFFLAQWLFAGEGHGNHKQGQYERIVEEPRRNLVLDIGSGAGFPGLPLKIWADQVRLTMVEANQKKSIFLREIVRAIGLQDVNVISERAETLAAKSDFAGAEVVTMRAVERFVKILPVALTLLAPNGRLALLIGRDQMKVFPQDVGIVWDPPIQVPESDSRVLCVGRKIGKWEENSLKSG
jgi:16S rRNA (guanine527-N7)-methyltransferase